MPSTSPSLLGRLRVRAGRALTDASWGALAHAGRHFPAAQPARYGVERLTDIAYTSVGAEHHRLDVYRPIERSGPLPVVLYVHGGGFRILSKDTHWFMAISFARRGYLVFNINYRLAPAHPFPAAIEDACAALVWVMENAARYGGDPTRLVLAGESAGANLVTSLAIATSWPRPEPWAQKVWESGARPVAAIPACGILQVSDVDRFVRRKRLPRFLHDRLREVEDAYLAPAAAPARDLADPLIWLERADPPVRPLPPFLAGVGTADVLLDDTRRLKTALDRLGVPCKAHYYPGEIHAFHALIWRPAARAFWKETFTFLQQHVPGAVG
ncbi:Esterase/lipase [Minicystis rosea]|nr:Esterase/lipase [Minicystis rosea]